MAKHDDERIAVEQGSGDVGFDIDHLDAKYIEIEFDPDGNVKRVREGQVARRRVRVPMWPLIIAALVLVAWALGIDPKGLLEVMPGL